ncbi:MAG: caspase family protein [Limnohabitans sp.]
MQCSVESSVQRSIRHVLLSLALVAPTAFAQNASVMRPTEIRAEKLASSAVLVQVNQGATVRVTSVEGGWVLVEANSDKGRVSGWVRASALNMQAGASLVAGLSSGREAAGNTAVTLGVRNVPPLVPRINRHALIIGVGTYEDPLVPPLPGTKLDKVSATQIAQAMQVPDGNIQYLHDSQATVSNIRTALNNLNDRVQDGDRVFIHYSGHGTRYKDPQAGGCVEALLPYDGMSKGMISNTEMASLLAQITQKTDKLFVMYDACHSGGLVAAAATARTRGIANSNDDGALRPKFAALSEECSKPVNIKTRSLVNEQVNRGALPQDIVHISAARDNEISFDDEQKGGLATQYFRDCMLREAKDLDGSGAISIEEIKQCAQEKINRRMQNDNNFKAHNLVLSGNGNFVPAWFSQGVPQTANVMTALATPDKPVAQVAVTPAPATPTPPPAQQIALATPSTTTTTATTQSQTLATSEIKPLSGEDALKQMYDQRNAKRKVRVTLTKDQLVIGKDALEFSVQSDRAGYVYAALAGSDGKALYMLFPNDLDQNNRIEAGQTLKLPQGKWRIKSSGPVGTNHLLVMVADAPRDLQALSAKKEGPFMTSLNDASGRAQLGALLTSSKAISTAVCQNTVSAKNNPLCSDAYGASLLSIKEVP